MCGAVKALYAIRSAMILRAPASGITCFWRASGSGIDADGRTETGATTGAAGTGAGSVAGVSGRSTDRVRFLESQHIRFVDASSRAAADHLCQVEMQFLCQAARNRGDSHLIQLASLCDNDCGFRHCA